MHLNATFHKNNTTYQCRTTIVFTIQYFPIYHKTDIADINVPSDFSRPTYATQGKTTAVSLHTHTQSYNHGGSIDLISTTRYSGTDNNLSHGLKATVQTISVSRAGLKYTAECRLAYTDVLQS